MKTWVCSPRVRVFWSVRAWLFIDTEKSEELVSSGPCLMCVFVGLRAISNRESSLASVAIVEIFVRPKGLSFLGRGSGGCRKGQPAKPLLSIPRCAACSRWPKGGLLLQRGSHLRQIPRMENVGTGTARRSGPGRSAPRAPESGPRPWHGNPAD